MIPPATLFQQNSQYLTNPEPVWDTEFRTAMNCNPNQIKLGLTKLATSQWVAEFAEIIFGSNGQRRIKRDHFVNQQAGVLSKTKDQTASIRYGNIEFKFERPSDEPGTIITGRRGGMSYGAGLPGLALLQRIFRESSRPKATVGRFSGQHQSGPIWMDRENARVLHEAITKNQRQSIQAINPAFPFESLIINRADFELYWQDGKDEGFRLNVRKTGRQLQVSNPGPKSPFDSQLYESDCLIIPAMPSIGRDGALYS